MVEVVNLRVPIATDPEPTAIEALSKKLDAMLQRLEERLARLDGAPAPVAPAVTAATPSSMAPPTPSSACSTPPTVLPTSISSTSDHKVFDEMSCQPAASVLHVTVSHMLYPVSKEVMHKLFDPYGAGEVQLLSVANQVEALVSFQCHHDAVQAREALHSRCIWDGCCWLDIQHVLADPREVSSPCQGASWSSSVEVASKPSTSLTGAQKVFDEMVTPWEVPVGVAHDAADGDLISMGHCIFGTTIGEHAAFTVMGIGNGVFCEADVVLDMGHKGNKESSSALLQPVRGAFLAVQTPAENLLVPSSRSEHKEHSAVEHFDKQSENLPSMQFCCSITKCKLQSLNGGISELLMPSYIVDVSRCDNCKKTYMHRAYVFGIKWKVPWPPPPGTWILPMLQFTTFIGLQHAWEELLLNGVLRPHKKLMAGFLTITTFGWVPAWQYVNLLKVCASIHIALDVPIQLLGVHWLRRNSENLLLWVGVVSSNVLQLSPEIATTCISLHGMCDSRVERSWPKDDCSSVEIHGSDQWRCNKQRSRHSGLVKVIELAYALACELLNGTKDFQLGACYWRGGLNCFSDPIFQLARSECLQINALDQRNSIHQFNLHHKIIIATLHNMDTNEHKFSGDNGSMGNRQGDNIKSWEQELSLALFTRRNEMGASLTWETSKAFCAQLSQLLALVWHHDGCTHQQTCWLELSFIHVDLATMARGVQAPWDPGGLVYQFDGYCKNWNHGDLKSVLGASRILSGGECHVLDMGRATRQAEGKDGPE